MTVRNFRVHNGISVGDIVISASTNTITGLTTAAPNADGDVANKKYVDDQLSGLDSFRITAGNTEVNVVDTGSGTITMVADSTSVVTVTSAGTTIANALTLSDNISLTGANKTVTLSPSGTGTVAISPAGALTINPTAASTINNTSIGGTTAAAGAFTTLAASSTLLVTGATTLSNTLNVTGAADLAADLRVRGNLTVDGDQVIVNTTVLSVEDNIIELNRGVSGNSGMPTFSGMKINRGELSSATEQDLYWVWDESFTEDGSTYETANAGGAFTALRANSEDASSPGAISTTDSALVDIRCRIIRAVATSAQYADIAERFAADAPMTEGAVVMLGGAQEITETADELSEQVFGVISSKPAYMMNAGAGNNESHPYVAMTGRTGVRVTGRVNKGDRLVSSSVRGTARAAAAGESINPFHVIGRALESKSDAGIGMVNCFVQAKN